MKICEHNYNLYIKIKIISLTRERAEDGLKIYTAFWHLNRKKTISRAQGPMQKSASIENEIFKKNSTILTRILNRRL